MTKQFFEKKEVHKKLWKLLFHDCYQVNLNSPSYKLSSDITRVFSPFVVPGTCLGPWTIVRYIVLATRTSWKFISSSQRVMFFLLYGETNLTKTKGGNRDVIERNDTHKGDIRKIRHSGPGWSGVWNVRVVSFPVKHSPPYSNFQYFVRHGLTSSGNVYNWEKTLKC